MHRTSSSATIKGRLAGASLLCFAVDPSFSCVYFLLGKERHNVRWPNGSNRWSDFGGRTASSDTCAEETAAREFFEETLAVVKYFDTDTLPRQGWGDIVDDLRSGRYAMRLTQGDSRRKFVTFVKQIPWDPAVVSRFSTYRTALTCPRFGVGGDTPPNVAYHPGLLRTHMDMPVMRKEFLEKKMNY